jgi:hypothetical protein
MTRVCRAAIFEVGMGAGLLSRDAAGRIVDQHHFKKVEAMIVEVGTEGFVLVAFPFREGGFEVGKAGLIHDAGPVGFSGGA